MTDSTQNEENSERVLAYHQLSKHHLRGYAASLGYLDWANQPDPFRTFAGAPALLVIAVLALASVVLARVFFRLFEGPFLPSSSQTRGRPSRFEPGQQVYGQS